MQRVYKKFLLTKSLFLFPCLFLYYIEESVKLVPLHFSRFAVFRSEARDDDGSLMIETTNLSPWITELSSNKF